MSYETHPTKPHRWVQASYGGPDSFGYEAGYHNGPRCEVCDFYFCEHCDPHLSATECGAATAVPGRASELGPWAAYSESLRGSFGLPPEGFDG